MGCEYKCTGRLTGAIMTGWTGATWIFFNTVYFHSCQLNVKTLVFCDNHILFDRVNYFLHSANHKHNTTVIYNTIEHRVTIQDILFDRVTYFIRLSSQIKSIIQQWFTMQYRVIVQGYAVWGRFILVEIVLIRATSKVEHVYLDAWPSMGEPAQVVRE